MKNDIWFKENSRFIMPFVDHSVKTNEQGKKVCSYGLSPSGYDIRLKEVRYFKSTFDDVIDPKKKLELKEVTPYLDKETGSKYIILPAGMTMIGVSTEYFRVPRNVSGFLLIKSTYGRCGVSVINPLIDAGFEGQLTVTFVNHNSLDCRIYLDEGFAQFVCFDVGECEVDYGEKGGNFQFSKGVTQGFKND